MFYIAGYGNVLGTYQYWSRGEDDRTIVAIAYSSQFFDICRRYGARAYIVSAFEERRKLNSGGFVFRERMIPFVSGSRWAYFFGQVYYAVEMMIRAVLFRSDVVILSTGVQHYLYSPLRLLGIKLISSMHNTLWPAGCSMPQSRGSRILLKLNGWYWRYIPSATICVSAEIERQIRKLTDRTKGEFYVVRAQYRRDYLDKTVPPPVHSSRPFRVMYAGRVEREKGVFDLLAVAEQLERETPGGYEWSICGTGSAMPELTSLVREKGLEGVFTLRGRMNHDEMAQMYGWCHIVVVPTTSQFAEGLNKVVVEGVLAGRPVITSFVCAASEFVNEAIMTVPPDHPEVYVEAIRHLSEDAYLYEFKCRACRFLQDQFYDRSYAWSTALDRILHEVLGWQPLESKEPVDVANKEAF